MKIKKSRKKKNKIFIECESQDEARALCSYHSDVGLMGTENPLNFYADLKQVPEKEFEKFKKELGVN